ncbi:hypothetical protein OG21DRAFT_596707 [Imleria badia]|nr:hypothetical protein OG21DRAFT_596707 [Imleria badia]
MREKWKKKRSRRLRRKRRKMRARSINDALQLSSCSRDACLSCDTKHVQVARVTSYCTYALLPLGNSGGTMRLPLFCWDSQEGGGGVCRVVNWNLVTLIRE